MRQTRAIDEGGTSWEWDVVERSRGGTERRLRLMSRMTENEARQWAVTHAAELHRVDESTPPAIRRAQASVRYRE